MQRSRLIGAAVSNGHPIRAVVSKEVLSLFQDVMSLGVNSLRSSNVFCLLLGQRRRCQWTNVKAILGQHDVFVENLKALKPLKQCRFNAGPAS